MSPTKEPVILLPNSSAISSPHWLRMPAPGSGNGMELFVFTGIGVFNSPLLKGTGQQWAGIEAQIGADYSNVIPKTRAIQAQQWTVDVHLASIADNGMAQDAGWSVNAFRLGIDESYGGGVAYALCNGGLSVTASVAIRDVDAFVLRLGYHVMILGKVVPYPGPKPPK